MAGARSADMTKDEATFSVLGTTAALFEAPGPMSLAVQRRVWALAREAQTWPEVREAVPGMNNLMLTFVDPPRHLAMLEDRLRAAWEIAQPLALEGRVIE